MKEALKELEHIEEWLNSLGEGWNYFGHVDRAKQRLKNAITLIKTCSIPDVIKSVCTCENSEKEKDSLVPVYCINCNAYVQTVL